MLQRRAFTLVASTCLALAVAQTASASPQISPTSLVTPGTVNGIDYISVWLESVNSAGFGVGNVTSDYDMNGNQAQLVWVFNPTTSSTSFIGFQASDSPDYQDAAGGNSTYNACSNFAPGAISSNGYVIGTISRNDAASGTPIGNDAWVSAPGTAANPTTGIVTPTLIGPITTLTDSNGVTTYYSFTATDASNKSYRDSTAVAVNTSGEVVGTASRYPNISGMSWMVNPVGTDVWVYKANGTLMPLGLGVSSSDAGYSGLKNATSGSNPTLYRSSSLISGSSLYSPNGNSLNDAGVVVGMTNRYDASAPAVDGLPTNYGRDAWMYNYNGSGSTVQIGLVGGVYEYNDGTHTTRSTTLTQLNASSQVSGHTSRYTTSGGDLGTDAWIYSPAGGTPGTSSSFGSGYVQVGLTDDAGAGVGHSVSTAGGTYRSSMVVALNNKGHAAGTSVRVSASSTNLGTDAWYDSGSGSSVNLSPTSPNITITGGTHSNYVAANGTLTQTVAALNSDGMAGGHLTRYNGASSVGQDAWVYDASKNMEYLLTSPSVTSASNFGVVQIMALSDAGVAVGYYQTAASGSGVPNADYIFAWTEAGGMVTLDQINTITGGIGGPAHVTPVAGLNNALAGQTGWAALVNSITTNTIDNYSPSLFVDGSGDIYGVGNTSSSALGSINGVFEITGVPEPSSLGVLAVAGLMVARRRRA